MSEDRWFEEVPLSAFGEIFQEIAEIVGLEKAMILYTNFNKTAVIFSNAPIYKAKEYWIRKNRYKYSVRYISRRLKVSPRFVYDALKKKGLSGEPKEPNLFDE